MKLSRRQGADCGMARMLSCASSNTLAFSVLTSCVRLVLSLTDDGVSIRRATTYNTRALSGADLSDTPNNFDKVIGADAAHATQNG